MSASPSPCPMTAESQTTLIISIVSSVLFLLSEYLGMRRGCDGKPKSLLGLIQRGVKSLTPTHSLSALPPTPTTTEAPPALAS